jgi:hypothetical protein
MRSSRGDRNGSKYRLSPTLFGEFMNTRNRSNPKGYAVTLKSKYKQNDAYTIELYEDFKADFLVAQELMSQYRDKPIYFDGQKLIIKSLAFVSEPPYSFVLRALGANGEECFHFKSLDDLKTKLQEWNNPPLPFLEHNHKQSE